MSITNFTERLKWDLAVIALNETAIKEVAVDFYAVVSGFGYFILYGFAFYSGLKSLSSDNFAILFSTYGLKVEDIPFLVGGLLVFDFVLLLLIHFVASFYKNIGFFELFRVMSRSYLLGIFSFLSQLNILMVWRFVVIYKSLRVLYEVSFWRALFIMVLSFVLFFGINAMVLTFSV